MGVRSWQVTQARLAAMFAAGCCLWASVIGVVGALTAPWLMRATTGLTVAGAGLAGAAACYAWLWVTGRP